MMKRSEINNRIAAAIEFMTEQNFHLPEWALWSPAQWADAGHEADEIRQRQLGWDVTDFGRGDYDNIGLLLFTIRNGLLTDTPDPMTKDYCEKILLVRDGQITPNHFHWAKMEDIINRAGAQLVLNLRYADSHTEQLDDTSQVVVSIDGIERTFAPGREVVLNPGQSITLPPFMYHNFYGRGGTVLAGEVSRVNDDANDNRFLEPLPRFPAIEEDALPLHLLCTEYPLARD